MDNDMSMSGKDKARLLGLLFWIFTALNILVVGIVAVVYISLFGFVFSQTPHKANEPDPAIIMTILVVIFAFAFVFVILFSIPKIVAGYGLRHQKSWARVWAIVASIMACMSFPLGTGIGVFGLVFLFGDDGKRYFEDLERGYLRSAAPALPPEPNSWR